MKTKSWLILIGVVFLLSAVACVFLYFGPAKTTAVITVDGVEQYRLNLRQDTTITVETRWGTNVITVSDGKISVTESDCPNQVCVSRGFANSGMPIICLPHRLVITFSEDDSVDAWTR